MRLSATLLAVTALSGMLMACTGLNPNPMDDADLYYVDLPAVREMAPEQGLPFNQGLRTGYLDLTDKEYALTDYTDAMHFARKAVASAKGGNVQPDAVAYRTLNDDQVTELGAARARMMAAFDMGARLRAPFDSARAQVNYDCWLEEEEEGRQEEIIVCKTAFEEAMAGIEQAAASGIEDVFVVFFAFDRADITPVAQAILDDVVQAWRDGRPSRIILAGHADRAGPADYNMRLSERRARSVAAVLAAQGVPDTTLDIQWFGETQNRVPTPDGVAEPQNRRVEITFE
ncbi:MAG TPA: OmpA family protein [Geminicoccaceae bacterium]|nr:OmpA family protein [Geminicoccaceae bacterium]